MKCPKCGKKMYVLDSRVTEQNEVIRHRGCKSCPYDIYTLEKPIEWEKGYSILHNIISQLCYNTRHKKEVKDVVNTSTGLTD